MITDEDPFEQENPDIVALDAVVIAMFARLPRLEPPVRALIGQILDDAHSLIDARTRDCGNRAVLVAALDKVDRIRDLALSISSGPAGITDGIQHPAGRRMQ